MCPVVVRGVILAPVAAVLLSCVTCGSDILPAFKSLPTTVKTYIHDTVLLPCYVDNLGTNNVRWWKDDRLVWDTMDPKVEPPANIRVFPNLTLEVSDVKDQDTGEYTCQVVRPEPWNPINQVHAIEVLVPPHVKTVPESGELEVELGHEVIMGCIVTGVPTPIVSWSYKGKDMELINHRPTLRFTATDRKMSGNYQCTANNGVGDSAAANIRLRVLFRPEVGAERLWVHTSPGERAEISCTVLSDPDSKVEWFHEDKAVELGDGRIMSYREGDKHKLLIKRVTSGDLGFFTCRATNLLGRGQQSIQLSGVANPAIFKRGPKQLCCFNFTLIWEVESYSPIIEYKLLFKKHQDAAVDRSWAEIIVPSDPSSAGPIHSQSYTLSGLQPTVVYEAVILSRNRFGWSRPSHIFRFATKGTDLNDKEEGLQEIDEGDDEEQELHEMIATKIENSRGDDASPIYDGNTWSKGFPLQTLGQGCLLLVTVLHCLFWCNTL